MKHIDLTHKYTVAEAFIAGKTVVHMTIRELYHCILKGTEHQILTQISGMNIFIDTDLNTLEDVTRNIVIENKQGLTDAELDDKISRKVEFITKYHRGIIFSMFNDATLF